MLHVSLLGSFCIQSDNQTIIAFKQQKVQELFCFLLLHRKQPHTREFLANVLWENASETQSKPYLRKCLWQLQSTTELESLPPLLLVESEWIQINPEVEIWVDTEILTATFLNCQGIPGKDLNANQIEALQNTVELYRGDLVKGCFADWCIFERERFQRLYLILLDKLLDHAVVLGDFEHGIVYGNQILRFDFAHERTHRQLMRLHYVAGDRTRAIRQYENCVEVLKKDLNISPTEETKMLLQIIKSDQNSLDFRVHRPELSQNPDKNWLYEITNKLDQIQSELFELKMQLSQ